jgi:transcriptional regulator with XRE-family HTH domain
MPETSDVRQRWAQYLNRLMSGRSQADFARLIDASDGQLSKWRSAQTGVKVETVIAIARKLGDSPLHALVEMGYLEPSDVAMFRVQKAFGLDEYTDVELSEEILRRVQKGSATAAITEPLEIEEDEYGTLRPIRRLHPVQDDLAEVASESITHDPDDTDDKYDA